MKKAIKTFLTILSILIIIALLFYLLKNNQEDIERIKNIQPYFIVLIIILTLAEFYINGLILKVLLEPFNIKIKIKEWLGLSLITTFGNYLTFLRGGTTTKAIYLKKYYNLSFPHFISSAGASYIITILLYGIIGIIFSLSMIFYRELFNPILFLIFLAVFIASLIAIFIPLKFFPLSENKIIKSIHNILDGWHKLRKNTHFILHFSFLSLILFFVSVSKLYLIYKSLSYPITFINAAFIALISNLSILISITPAGLGVREAFIAATSSLLNLGLSSGLYVSALERAITIILISILGPISIYLLIKKPKQIS